MQTSGFGSPNPMNAPPSYPQPSQAESLFAASQLIDANLQKDETFVGDLNQYLDSPKSSSEYTTEFDRQGHFTKKTIVELPDTLLQQYDSIHF